MPKANKGKRLLNLPDAASYFAFAYNRGVEHGKREEQRRILEAAKKKKVMSWKTIEAIMKENK